MVIECKEIIEAPPEFVFEVLHDYQLRLDWDPFLREARLLDQATVAGLGVRALCSVKRRLLGWSMTTEYVSFQPGEVAAVKMTEGPFFFESFAASLRHKGPPEGGHRSGDASVSEVLYRLNFSLRPGLGSLVTSLIGRCLKWETTQRLKALRLFCEGDSKTELKQVELEPGLSVSCKSREEARFLYQEVFEEDCYLAGLPHLGVSPVIIDVGSNIGLFALRALKEYPEARLSCLEPGPETFRALQKNLESRSVSLHKMAAGSEAGLLSFYYYPLVPGNSSLYPRQLTTELVDKLYTAFKATFDTWWKPFIVRPLFGLVTRVLWGRPRVSVTRVTKLSTLLQDEQGPIALLKIDVERAEWDVLQGIDADDWARIKHIAVEVTSLDWGHGHLERIVSLLENKGFHVRVEEKELNRIARLAIEEQLELDGRIDHLVFGSRS